LPLTTAPFSVVSPPLARVNAPEAVTWLFWLVSVVPFSVERCPLAESSMVKPF